MKIYNLFIIMCISLFFVSCNSEEDISDYLKFNTEELRVSAEAGDTTFTIQAKGYSWQLKENADWIKVNKDIGVKTADASETPITITISANPDYEERSATISLISYVLPTQKITIIQEGKSIPQFEAVDLGLSVLWANMNLGAELPEEYGDYYFWGYTKVMSIDEWVEAESIEKKYLNNKNLLPEDDPASVVLGSDWRTPTEEEVNELIKNCTWTLTKNAGVNGFEVKGKNGNSIFLPMSGFQTYDTWDRGTTGCILVSNRYLIGEFDGTTGVYGTILEYKDGDIGVHATLGDAVPVRAVKK